MDFKNKLDEFLGDIGEGALDKAGQFLLEKTDIGKKASEQQAQNIWERFASDKSTWIIIGVCALALIYFMGKKR